MRVCATYWTMPLASKHINYYENILGGNSGGVTPVPIPNTEVKTVYGDGTALARVWESSKPPG